MKHNVNKVTYKVRGDMPTPPSEEQIIDWFEDLSNWGRWGDDDRLGTLNHLTAAKRVSAAKLVREGLSISCSWDIRTGQQPGATVESQRYMLSTGLGLDEEGRRGLEPNPSPGLDGPRSCRSKGIPERSRKRIGVLVLAEELRRHESDCGRVPE